MAEGAVLFSMTLHKRFQSLFSPRRYLQTRNSLSRPAGKRPGPRQWVMARSLCLYNVFVLGDIPAAERVNALNLRIRQWSPFAETGRYILWSASGSPLIAHVWIWDDAERDKAAKGSEKNIRIFPETAFHKPPEEDMLRLAVCTEGLEAQIWRSGNLEAGRWWPDIPPDDEWKRFLIAHDMNPDIQIPRAEDIPWLDRPWGKVSDESRLIILRHERLWVFLIMALLLCLLIWEGVSVWRWTEAVKAIEERVEVLTRETEPLLEARKRATQEKETVERLLSMTTPPSQLELMAAITEKLSRRKVLLAEWHYNRERLRFVLRGNNLDPRYYVETCQKMPWFREVTAERGRGDDLLVVSCQLSGDHNADYNGTLEHE